VRAVVVGGAGFLGSHLVDRLLAEGHGVDVVDDLSGGSLANLGSARADRANAVKFHHLDIRRPELVELLERRQPDLVYHLAAPAPGADARTLLEVMVVGAQNVAEATRRSGAAKIVAALWAADLYGDVPARDLPVKEAQPWQARTVRGVAARAVADLLAVYRQDQSVEYTVLAVTNVYGPRQRPDRGVVASFAAAAAEGDQAVIHGDGRQTRDFLYVDDAVDALVRAARRGTGLVVNVGTGEQTSVRELHRLLCGPDALLPVHAPPRPGEPARFAVSPVRAKIHLDWAPFTSLQEGIAALDEPVVIGTDPPGVA
jgi:UDP-glucose 4-epimerase